jgi:hypothetical protein
VVLAELFLSLLMPDIVVNLCVLGIGVAGFVADDIAAASHSRMAQAILRQPGAGPHSYLTWWKVVYYVWPKFPDVQQSATSLLGNEPFMGSAPFIHSSMVFWTASFLAQCFSGVSGMKT